MLLFQVSKLFQPHRRLLHILLACTAGLLLGAGSIMISPVWTLAAVLAAGMGYATLKRPELGLLAWLVGTSTIMPFEGLPSVYLGANRLIITDMALVLLLGIVALRALVERGFFVHTPLDWPLLAFYGIGLFWTWLGIARSSVDTKLAMRELRAMTYYLAFFVVTNLVRTRQQLWLLVRGLIVLSVGVAVAMIVQFLVGDSIHLLPGRVETLVTQSVRYEGITRILPPGQSVVFVSFLAVTAVLALGRPTAVLLISWGALAAAVLFSFNRSFWMGGSLAILALVWVVRGRDRSRLLGLILLVALVLGGVWLLSSISRPDSRFAHLSEAVQQRAKTLLGPEEISEDQSFRWRDLEYEYAWPHIKAHPLQGMGLGARYRPLDKRMDWETFDGRAYIHNAHVWILMKTGVMGYIALLWLSIGSLVRGLHHWSHVDHPQMRGVLLGFSLVQLAVAVGAIVAPMYMQEFWTPVLGTMIGINEVAIRVFSRPLPTVERSGIDQR